MASEQPSRVWDRRTVLRRSLAIVSTAVISGCLDGPDTDETAPNGDRDTNENDSTDGQTTDGTTSDGDRDTDDPAAYERAIHDRVNAIRSENDREPYEYHEEIAAVARAHSVDMVEQGYFGHESPGGEDSSDRLEEFFPGHCMGVAENIVHVAGGPDTDPDVVAERALSLWLDSAGHRRNVLSEAFDEEGVGVAFADERVVITQNFCATAD